MHNETSALPFLGHVPLSRLATRHSRDLACHGGCHLEHRHCTAASGYRSATVDAREAQCLEPLTGDGSVVSASELPSRPLIPTPQVLAHSSDLAGRLGRERVYCFPSILPFSHNAFRAHGSHCRRVMLPAKIERHLSVLPWSIVRVTAGSHRITPPTTSRTMTPHFLHRTQTLCRPML
ncbi:hypothetical protein EV401DRAFT_1939622 [Pisolithus croceorrhizus]|nr:hypothetical protein EV401DRAFT_1939622 [Pisolithus croceorrhizus]